MFDSFDVNLLKNEGFLTSIPRIPIPEYGQSNAPKVLTISTRILRLFVNFSQLTISRLCKFRDGSGIMNHAES